MIREGGVAVGGGTIVAVDVLARLRQQFPQAEVIDHSGCALTPALVNAHIHLELSHLGELSLSPQPASFTGWISRLLELRDRLGATGAQVRLAAEQTAEQQHRSGVAALADIGNTSLGRDLTNAFAGALLPFKEYLGLAEWTLEKNLHRLSQEPEEMLCSGHAPYSTHPRLLQALKKRATSHGQVFPLHTAEPAAEGQMIREGRGEMVDFVRARGFWDNSFVPRGRGGSIHYLHELGLLDERTLCIHCVHVSDEETRMLAGEGAKICLCPGSNRFLGVGRAPLRQYLDQGLLPALGTDSLASNPELSLWREMALLAEDFTDIDPATLFAMATRGGAEALGVDYRLGTLEPGKDADLLVVPLPDQLTQAVQVSRYLVHGGTSIQPTRINR
jgi:cytosine/adenosine deaminase-related metal-dependent hydrolase